MSKKITSGSLRFVSTSFLISEKGISKKIVGGILRFVTILSLIIEKGKRKKMRSEFKDP